jgi:hypothetical protein
MSPRNRQLFEEPENGKPEPSMTLSAENVPPSEVPSILGELQNHDIKCPWLVGLTCRSEIKPSGEFFSNN